MIDLTLAHAKVSSIEAAEDWYGTVFGSPPDSRPMRGLIEWRFGPAHGVQVFHDPSAAGGSAVVVGAIDLDAMVARLEAHGIEHGGIQPGGRGRLVELLDPDGNALVILDGEAAHELPSDGIAQGSLRLLRRFDVAVERLWAAYADVEQRSAWAVPEGEELDYTEADFATGGTDTYRCGPPGRLENLVSTRYLHVDAPRSFVATNEVCRSGTLLAVDTAHWQLQPDGDATSLLVSVQVTSLAGPGVLDGYRTGHERTLDHLEGFLG